MNATAEAIAALTALSQRAEALAAALPSLDLPATALADVVAQVRRLDMRLQMIEDGIGALGPVPT
jgi:hypothetical protein